MEAANVLLIDDDQSYEKLIQEILTPHFNLHFYSAHSSTFSNAREVVEKLKPQIILLDIRLDNISGIEICQTLRSNPATQANRILMLTGVLDDEIRLRAFQAGADDFIEKPFLPAELVARIQSKVRRLEADYHQYSELLSCGNLNMNLDRFEVSVAGLSIALTDHEFRLLKYLILNKEKACSREVILKEIWNGTSVVSRTVDIHVSNLRKKLNGFNYEFQSVYGRGYMLTQTG